MHGHDLEVADLDPRKHRAIARGDVVAGDEAVLVLDQQPLLRFLRAHQREGALEFLAAQLDAELALVDAFADLAFGFGAVVEPEAVLVGAVHAAIPHDHFARAVLSGRNHAFERAVVERMVLDEHRQALVAGSSDGPFGTAQDFSTPSHCSRKS